MTQNVQPREDAANKASNELKQFDGESSTARNGFYSLADQVVVSGTRFLIAILIAKACGEAELGVYALVMSLALMSLMIQQTLITTPYSNFRNRIDRNRGYQYLCDTWFLSLGLSIVAVVVMLIVAAVLWGVSSWLGTAQDQLVEPFEIFARLSSASCSVAVAVPCMIGLEFFRRVWLIRMRAIRALCLDASVNSIVVAILGALFWSGNLNTNSVFLSIAGVSLCGVLVAIRIQLPQVHLVRTSLSETTKNHWRFGKWIFSSEAVTFGRANLIKWIIGGFLGIGATGIYSACDSLMRVINPFFLGIASVAEPTLAKGYAKAGRAEVKRIAFKVVGIMALGSLPICLTVSFGSRYLLENLYGPNFADYNAVVVWLAASSFLFSIGYPLSNSLQAIDRPDINFRIRMTTFVVVIIAAMTVTPIWGLWGVAVVQFIGTALAFCLRLYFFQSFFSQSRQPPGAQNETPSARIVP